jgi:NADPH:quinone reductase-like Zn-dependent oxidoreductase
MKAYVLRAYGSPDQLDFTAVDTPVPADGEVLVRVRATSVNPYDWHGLRGEPRIARLMGGGLGLRAPKFPVLGCDMAGQVEAVGPGVTEFSPGDDVFALLEAGGWAEYARVPARLLARMPRNRSYAEAAVVPMAAATALLALRDTGRLKAGQRVLVNGASGGVGLFAVQLARALGATVDAVCGAANADQARSAGAGDVIDYAREDFTRRGQRYDLLLDIAGGTGVFACRRALARTGTLVLVGGPAGRWVQPAGHVLAAAALGPLTGRRTVLADIVSSPAKQELLPTLAALIEDGQVTPVISRTYAFSELREAVAYQEQGHVPAKVAVTV